VKVGTTKFSARVKNLSPPPRRLFKAWKNTRITGKRSLRLWQAIKSGDVGIYASQLTLLETQETRPIRQNNQTQETRRERRAFDENGCETFTRNARRFASSRRFTRPPKSENARCRSRGDGD
jgi:hypothetical protein